MRKLNTILKGFITSAFLLGAGFIISAFTFNSAPEITKNPYSEFMNEFHMAPQMYNYKDVGSFKEGFLPIWKQMKAYTLEIADAMPAEKYNAKPGGVDSVRSFAQQMKHLAGTMHFVNNVFLKGEAPTPPDPEFENTGLSKDEIKGFLSMSFDAVATTIEGMTDEQFNERAVLFFHPEKPEYSKSAYVGFLWDHTTHHRAQAVRDLRYNGVAPPRYRYF